MNTKIRLGFAAVLLAALFSGGCATVSDGDADGGQPAVEDVDAGAAASGAAMNGEFQGHPLDDPDSPLSKRVFYFDFDSSEMSESDRQTLLAHGKYLASHPELAIVVEGHADERGTREYNLALGERRAQAAESVLLIQGTGKNQLQVVSFGEERPVALGHEESSWRLNRRVELIYSGY